MIVLQVIWRDDQGRRCTTFYEAPEVKGDIINIEYRTKEELDKLASLTKKED